MTATPPDVPGLLLARASDREAEAPDIHRADCGAFLNDALGGGYIRSGCDCGVPARVLADCAALRAIVKLHKRYEQGVGMTDDGVTYWPNCEVCDAGDVAALEAGEGWPCQTLRLLAPEWRV